MSLSSRRFCKNSSKLPNRSSESVSVSEQLEGFYKNLQKGNIGCTFLTDKVNTFQDGFHGKLILGNTKTVITFTDLDLTFGMAEAERHS